MNKMKNKPTHLIVAASENDPEMLYVFVIPSESLTLRVKSNGSRNGAAGEAAI
jgi:hypothetical protein